MVDRLLDFSRETIDGLLDMLAAEAKKKLPGILRDPSMFPENRLAFEGLLRTLYLASLDKNEGRALAVSVALVPSTRAEQAIVFEKPLEVTKTNLVAVAPIAQRSFALGITEVGDGYFAWGVIPKPIPCLSIRVAEPGFLLIRVDYENAAILAGDECILAGVGPAHALRIIAHGLDSASIAEPQRIVLAALLIQVVDGMRRHGNGGTLVVGPSNSDEWKAGLKIRRSLEPFKGLAERVEKYAEKLRAEQSKPGFWAPDGTSHPSWFALPVVPDLDGYLVGDYSSVPPDLNRLVETIAQLTAVDGATVVNDRLEVLGFSAVLDAVPAVERIATWPMPSVLARREPVDTRFDDLGGTRHRSAARFVSAHHECVALAVSHDGPVSFIAWDSGRETTLVFRRIELFLDRYW